MGTILSSTWKQHWKDPDRSTLNWVFKVLPPEFILGSGQLYHWIIFFAQFTWVVPKKPLTTRSVQLYKKEDVVLYPEGTGEDVFSYGHTCPALGRNQVWVALPTPVPCRAVTLFLAWCGAGSGPGTGDRPQCWGGACGCTEGFGEKKHRCTQGLNAVTAFQWTDSAALN